MAPRSAPTDGRPTRGWPPGSEWTVRHKAKQPYEPDIRDFYKMFFLRRQVDAERARPGFDIMDTAYFARDRIPELSRGGVIAGDIEAAFAFHDGPARPAVVD